jgi:hypothetical protein
MVAPPPFPPGNGPNPKGYKYPNINHSFICALARENWSNSSPCGTPAPALLFWGTLIRHFY